MTHELVHGRPARRWRARSALLVALVVAGPAAAAASPTYYVDGAAGSDAYTAAEAASPATPWKTIKKAVSAGGLIGMTNKGVVLDGYTVVVAPGIYMESVESKRDGLSTAPVTIKAASPGSVTIKPPAGSNGFFISHHYHVIDGFVVSGGNIGLKLGPHDGGDGPASGLVAVRTQVSGNALHGIQFANAQDGVAAFNTIAQNGQDGISYAGNGGVIHDNAIRDNGRFGIYVKSGINYQLWNNSVSGNAGADFKVQGSQVPPPGGRTFYVGAGGSDAYDDVRAQSPATPWATFNRALGMAVPGDTVAILPGTYAQSVQSVRDGAPGAPITIVAATVGTVTIAPPSGSGVYIGHHHHVVEGLGVTGAGTAFQMGPYKETGGQVNGLSVLYGEASGNGAGIRFTNVVSATAMHNVVTRNAKDGIAYTWANQSNCPAGSGATIFNNLVYDNGANLSGEYGITVGCGDANQVASNTVSGNLNGGIRLGVAGAVPVLGTVVNNIVTGSPVGVKEPAGSNYTGRVTLDFNDVYGNGQGYALGPLTKAGPSSIAVPPGFIDPAGGDFRLGRVATGQAADSAAIDKGSDLATALGLGGRTAFSDKYPDTGRADLGYHGTPLYPSAGTATVEAASLAVASDGSVGFTFSGVLRTGAGSDGMSPGADYAEVVFGEWTFPIWVGLQAGQPFASNGGTASATVTPLADGGVRFAVRASGLALGALRFPTSVSLRVGDDVGSASALLAGTLQIP